MLESYEFVRCIIQQHPKANTIPWPQARLELAIITQVYPNLGQNFRKSANSALLSGAIKPLQKKICNKLKERLTGVKPHMKENNVENLIDCLYMY